LPHDACWYEWQKCVQITLVIGDIRLYTLASPATGHFLEFQLFNYSGDFRAT